MVPTCPLALAKITVHKIPNVNILTLLYTKYALWVLLYTLILSKYLKYTATVIVGKLKKKTPIVYHHLLSVQTAYCETGVSYRSNSLMKIIYTGAFMILDA